MLQKPLWTHIYQYDDDTSPRKEKKDTKLILIFAIYPFEQ